MFNLFYWMAAAIVMAPSAAGGHPPPCRGDAQSPEPPAAARRCEPARASANARRGSVAARVPPWRLIDVANAQAGAEDKIRRFDLVVAEGRTGGESNTIRVTEGDTVEIRWRSDAPIELHLHGYDIEAKVTPQSPAVMRFEATITGRFKVEQHGAHGRHHHDAVLYIEVYPK